MQIFPVNRFGVSLEINNQIVENGSAMIKLYHVLQTVIIIVHGVIIDAEPLKADIWISKEV